MVLLIWPCPGTDTPLHLGTSKLDTAPVIPKSGGAMVGSSQGPQENEGNSASTDRSAFSFCFQTLWKLVCLTLGPAANSSIAGEREHRQGEGDMQGHYCEAVFLDV